MRIAVALLPIVLLVVAVRALGVMDRFDVASVREIIEQAGIWGTPLFVLVYALGILAHVPGSVFVAAGVVIFGSGGGLAWCYLGALLGNLLSFGLVRWTGYRPLANAPWPAAEALFAQLTARPIRSVTGIRMIFPSTAPVNYALALTEVSFSAYLIGSLVGVLPQLLACIWLFSFALE